jgi:hypothetical protein
VGGRRYGDTISVLQNIYRAREGWWGDEGMVIQSRSYKIFIVPGRGGEMKVR